MYDRICNWWSCAIFTLYAHLPHRMYRRLAYAKFYLSILYGTSRCGLVNNVRKPLSPFYTKYRECFSSMKKLYVQSRHSYIPMGALNIHSEFQILGEHNILWASMLVNAFWAWFSTASVIIKTHIAILGVP